MIRVTFVPVAFVGLMLAGCANSLESFANTSDEKAERAKLRGAWAASAVVVQGQADTGGDARALKIVFGETTVEIQVRDEVHAGTYEIGSAWPRQVNIAPGKGNTSDGPLYGIYEVTSTGELLLCFSPTERPTKFESGTGKDWTLIRLSRTQPR
jgi:uncharacterized protein (TIGR03067 family)